MKFCLIHKLALTIRIIDDAWSEVANECVKLGHMRFANRAVKDLKDNLWSKKIIYGLKDLKDNLWSRS